MLTAARPSGAGSVTGGVAPGWGAGRDLELADRDLDLDLRRRLEKLARRYDLLTMKLYMAAEALGEAEVYAAYVQGEVLLTFYLVA